MGPASKHAIPIKGQSVLITPKSGRCPPVCGLFFEHFIAPEHPTRRHNAALDRRSELLLHLFTGRPAIGHFQIPTLFGNEQGTTSRQAESDERYRECGLHGFHHHNLMVLCPP